MRRVEGYRHALLLVHRKEISGQLYVPAALPLGRMPHYPLDPRNWCSLNLQQYHSENVKNSHVPIISHPMTGLSTITDSSRCISFVVCYIIIYLTANGQSPGGSGYNACT